MSEIAFRPLSDLVWIELLPEPGQGQTPGGLYVPETVQRERRVVRARVLGVGPGLVTTLGTLVPLEVGVGDIILYERMSASYFEARGKGYGVVRERNILGVVEGD